MKRYTLKELENLKLSDLAGKDFTATKDQYDLIAEALDKIPGLTWIDNQKPSGYFPFIYYPSQLCRFHITISGMYACTLTSPNNPLTTITIDLSEDQGKLKQYTPQQLKQATLNELEGTYFKCTPKRYKRICKALDCVEGLKWTSGSKPSGYGTGMYLHAPYSDLYYLIMDGRMRRGAEDSFSLRRGLTRISIKA